MARIQPQPGQWVLIRAKVLDQMTAPECVVVELFSKTDQYAAHVRRDHVMQVVPAPIPDEPDDGAVVMVDGSLYQRLTDHWYRPGRPETYTWLDLVAIQAEPTVLVWP